MKKYIELQPTRKATHLKVEVYYNLGGYNYFTCKEEKRGYYLSVSPVTRSTTDGIAFESYTAFTGQKYLVKEVTRKSAKAEAEAVEKAAKIENTLVSWVLEENGLQLAEAGATV